MPRSEIDNLGLVLVAALDSLQQQGLDLADIEDDRALEQTTAIIYSRLLGDYDGPDSVTRKRGLALSEALKIRKMIAKRERGESDG